MEKNDLVTIIIPVHNSAKYLKETRASIEKQTYENYEAIFIDDCSTDDSVKIIEGYKDERIKLIRFLEYQGVSKARNAGIEKAKGRYLTFLDSDDIWVEDKLEKQINFIKKNNYDFIYCDFKYISDDGKMISKRVKAGNVTNYNKALLDIRILTITAMIDLSKIPKEYCYMPDVMNEDVATWWNILKKGYVAYGQNEVLAYYRKTKKSRSSRKYITAFYRWKLYRKQQNLSFFKSIYCFVYYVVNGICKRIGKMERYES